jgi:hypothetical protein
MDDTKIDFRRDQYEWDPNYPEVRQIVADHISKYRCDNILSGHVLADPNFDIAKIKGVIKANLKSEVSRAILEHVEITEQDCGMPKGVTFHGELMVIHKEKFNDLVDGVMRYVCEKVDTYRRIHL